MELLVLWLTLKILIGINKLSPNIIVLSYMLNCKFLVTL